MNEQDKYGYVIIAIVGAGILFFVLRELFCWYYKVNDRIELQKETNRLLRKIAGEDALPEKTNENVGTKND